MKARSPVGPDHRRQDLQSATTGRAGPGRAGHGHHRVLPGGDSISAHCLDYLEVDGKIQVFKSKKKSTTSTHGSGCIFSSALTIFLAKKYSLIESLKKSKKFINKQIELSPKLNVKYGPLI